MFTFSGSLSEMLEPSKERAFTLMEVLVAMTIMAIVSLVAAPRLSMLYDSINKRAAEMLVLEDMRYA